METEEAPLIVRQEPPKTQRIDKKKLGLVFGAFGAALVVFFGVKLQGRHAAEQAIPSAPLPSVHEVSGDGSFDHMLTIPTSYEGIDRRPKTPPPREEPPPVQHELPPLVQYTPPFTPAAAPAVSPAHPPAGPAPVPRQAPKKWLFAESATAQPPFPKPEKPVDGTSDLVQPAEWATPKDPTRVLYRSQVIPGLLLHEVNSDIPGPVRIMVTRPVTDRFQQGRVLIPQHSILLGQQEGKPQFGHTRLAATIDEMQFPDGTIVRLKGNLADRGGASGATGKLNNHYVKLGVAALLSAALHIGVRGVAGGTTGFQPTVEQEYARDVGQSVNRTGQSIVDRALNVPPTVVINAGTEITVSLSENVSFQKPPAVTQ